jgi:hypothetical protein
LEIWIVTEPGADFDNEANTEPHDAAAAPASPDDKVERRGELAPKNGASPPGTPQAVTGANSHASNFMILWPERPARDETHAESDADDPINEPRTARSALRRRRRMALAAGIALAALCGATGGSLATFALGRIGTPQTALAADADNTARLKEALARVTADLGNLRADLDRTGHARTSQIAKLGDRIDKVEKAQDDTTARLTRLSETQDRLQDKAQDRMRAAGASSAAVETTGSISTPAAAKGDMRADARKPQVVDGWTLSRVTGGGAIVNGPDGLYEAFPGDPLPGLGRVDAVRYQDGRWVVITPKGMIIRR